MSECVIKKKCTTNVHGRRVPVRLPLKLGTHYFQNNMQGNKHFGRFAAMLRTSTTKVRSRQSFARTCQYLLGVRTSVANVRPKRSACTQNVRRKADNRQITTDRCECAWSLLSVFAYILKCTENVALHLKLHVTLQIIRTESHIKTKITIIWE